MRTTSFANLICTLAAALLLTAQAAYAADAQQQEANKKIVLEFYEKGLNQKDGEAAAKYFGSRSSVTRWRPMARRDSRTSSSTCAINFPSHAARSSARSPM